MKHSLLIAAAASALMATPLIASAQDSGVYIKGQAGYGVFSDVDILPTDSQFSGLLGEANGEGNLALSAALGYDFGNGWRAEFEAGQLYNDMGAIDGQPGSQGDLRSTSLMLNALYDFTDFGRWEPYVGAGVGFTRHDGNFAAQDLLVGANNVLVRHPVCVTPPVGPGAARACVANSGNTSFTWNLIAGLGYNITDNLTWDTTYRYTDYGSAEFDGQFIQGGPAAAAPSPLSATLEDLASHQILTGFRYRFGKAVPPPPPPPPPTFTCDDGTVVTDLDLCPIPTFTCWDGVTEVTDLALCPPQTFLCPDGVTSVTDLATCPVMAQCEEQFRQELIYYEFDVAQSAETRNTINRILDVGQFCRIDNIRVVGHTDTSGPVGYNQRLSERRAADAVEELVRQGQSADIISSEGKGETEPFVQTGDGVREQLNRRTEVLLTLSEVGTAMISN
ncbi:MAG: outer membrane beta-barrel protein [Pseudomonadota bacterium]